MDGIESIAPGKGTTWARLIAALVFLIGGILSATALSMAAVWRDNRPNLALRAWPYDARAMAGSAEQQLQTASGANMPRSTVKLLRRALLRDPTAVNAWRTLGIRAYTAGDQETGLRYLLISQSLSARDSLTQLWLIEDSTRRGDVDDALKHYDIALRTSARTADLLLPTLVSATEEPVVAKKVAALLSQNPPWSSRFIDFFAQNAPSARAATQLVAAMPTAGRSEHMDSFKKLIPLLIERGDYKDAATIYSLLSGSRSAGLQDSNFTGQSAFSPFEWDLTDTPDLRAERVSGSGSERGLLVSAANGAIAIVARQMVILAPGPYGLRSKTGPQSEAPVDKLLWRVTCAGSDRKLLELDVTPRQSGSKTTGRTFSVPANCPAQWISLEVTAPESSVGSEAWVYWVAVNPPTAAGEGTDR